MGGGVFAFVVWVGCFDGVMKVLLLLLGLLLLGLSGVCVAGGDKKQSVALSLHLETEGTDNPKMIFPQFVGGKQRFFRKMPEVSSRDFVAFSPFPSDDGMSYGVVFVLKEAAKRRYAAVTNMNTGRWLLAHVNGRVADAVLIDKAVEDGLVVVWKGISLEEIGEFDKAMPRVGEAKKKGKKG